MQKERVLVTGASGFIGSNLLDYLLEKDYEVIGLSRQKNLPKIHPHLTWIRALEELKHDRIDYVVNLAGESIAQGRWTDTRKQKLIASRVETTTMLYQYLAKERLNRNVLFQVRQWVITVLIRLNNGQSVVMSSQLRSLFLCQSCVKNGNNLHGKTLRKIPKLFV